MEHLKKIINMKKTIYNIGLHENINASNNTDVTKVPGGWLYTVYSLETGEAQTSTFVPFNNEFQ